MSKEISKKNPSTADTAYRFAEFELSPAERTLRRHGDVLPLAPKSFDALLHLVRNAEHLVTKRELMETLWPDTFVTEANLTNTVSTLRKVLGPNAIRTVAKHGYRFDLPVAGEPGISRDVYELFTRAKELTLQRSLESVMRARELFWICLAEDPGFAVAWAWLGRCCWFLAKFAGNPSADVELAGAALRRALLIDPDIACAHQFCTPLEADTGLARRALPRLLSRLERNPDEPESFVGLVQVLRFCGLLRESVAAHQQATTLDPTVSTSLPHTLFLAGDYAGAIDAYGGRASYYLDVAAWAAMGDQARAGRLLRERLAKSSLSVMMHGLMASLAAILEDEFDEAARCMRNITMPYEPEVRVYLARHYSYIGSTDTAVEALRQAAESGFVCAPETLQDDPWLKNVRHHRDFPQLVREAARLTGETRSLVTGTRCDVST